MTWCWSWPGFFLSSGLLAEAGQPEADGAVLADGGDGFVDAGTFACGQCRDVAFDAADQFPDLADLLLRGGRGRACPVVGAGAVGDGDRADGVAGVLVVQQRAGFAPDAVA